MKTQTLKPWQRDGSTGFTREDGTRQCTGSMMGRRNCLPEDVEAPQKLRMERLRLVGGDYDAGGAYWGSGPQGSAIFCAYNDECEIFVRATEAFGWGDIRDAAKRQVREVLPAAKFHN